MNDCRLHAAQRRTPSETRLRAGYALRHNDYANPQLSGWSQVSWNSVVLQVLPRQDRDFGFAHGLSWTSHLKPYHCAARAPGALIPRCRTNFSLGTTREEVVTLLHILQPSKKNSGSLSMRCSRRTAENGQGQSFDTSITTIWQALRDVSNQVQQHLGKADGHTTLPNGFISGLLQPVGMITLVLNVPFSPDHAPLHTTSYLWALTSHSQRYGFESWVSFYRPFSVLSNVEMFFYLIVWVVQLILVIILPSLSKSFNSFFGSALYCRLGGSWGLRLSVIHSLLHPTFAWLILLDRPESLRLFFMKHRR